MHADHPPVGAGEPSPVVADTRYQGSTTLLTVRRPLRSGPRAETRTRPTTTTVLVQQRRGLARRVVPPLRLAKPCRRIRSRVRDMPRSARHGLLLARAFSVLREDATGNLVKVAGPAPGSLVNTTTSSTATSATLTPVQATIPAAASRISGVMLRSARCESARAQLLGTHCVGGEEIIGVLKGRHD